MLAKKLLVHNISFYFKGDCVTFTVRTPGEALPVLVSAPPLREGVAVGELPAELLLLVVGEEEAVAGVVPAQVQAALEVLGGDLGHDQRSKGFSFVGNVEFLDVRYTVFVYSPCAFSFCVAVLP